MEIKLREYSIRFHFLLRILNFCSFGHLGAFGHLWLWNTPLFVVRNAVGLLSKAVYHTNVSSITGYSSNGRCIDAVHGYNQLSINPYAERKFVSYIVSHNASLFNHRLAVASSFYEHEDCGQCLIILSYLFIIHNVPYFVFNMFGWRTQ